MGEGLKRSRSPFFWEGGALREEGGVCLGRYNYNTVTPPSGTYFINVAPTPIRTQPPVRLRCLEVRAVSF